MSFINQKNISTFIQSAKALGTLKKAVDDRSDALSKKADIIFMFLGFSSLAIGFAKYAYKKGNTQTFGTRNKEYF